MDKSKVGFGLDQVNNVTPPFANWIFRGYFIVSKAFIGWMAAVGIFTPHELFVTLTTVNLLLDPIMYGFSKLFGVVPDSPTGGTALIADKQVDKSGDVKAVNPVLVPPIGSIPGGGGNSPYSAPGS